MSRSAAVERIVRTLRFLWSSPQGPEPDATGYRGFFYHFLDMQTGRRARQCELSTVDSTFLLAGALTAALYFTADTPDEQEIRSLADALYRRADWQWAQNGGSTVTHGWTPEAGFLSYRWEGYDEALLLYVLGLGSPTHPLPESSYLAWCSTYEWRSVCGQEYLYAGSLFTHQLSHIWIDFRGIQDPFMRAHGIDYFENTRRATYAQQRYAIENPENFDGYSRDCWGITACEGPGPSAMTVNGIEREFFDYVARGIPYGPDDGTTTNNFNKLLQASAGTNLHHAIVIQSNITGAASEDSIAASIRYVLDNWAYGPNYLRLGGRPVLIFTDMNRPWGSDAAAANGWARIRATVDPNHNSIWMAEGLYPTFNPLFDGLYVYRIDHRDYPQSWLKQPRWAAGLRAVENQTGANLYFADTIAPGFDDTRSVNLPGDLRSSAPPFARDRQAGAYYADTFAVTSQTGGDFLMVKSFNEWIEGTEIEPGASYGDAYLHQTCGFANEYRSR